jgi:hypothetical protein
LFFTQHFPRFFSYSQLTSVPKPIEHTQTFLTGRPCGRVPRPTDIRKDRDRKSNFHTDAHIHIQIHIHQPIGTCDHDPIASRQPRFYIPSFNSTPAGRSPPCGANAYSRMKVARERRKLGYVRLCAGTQELVGAGMARRELIGLSGWLAMQGAVESRPKAELLHASIHAAGPSGIGGQNGKRRACRRDRTDDERTQNRRKRGTDSEKSGLLFPFPCHPYISRFVVLHIVAVQLGCADSR